MQTLDFILNAVEHWRVWSLRCHNLIYNFNSSLWLLCGGWNGEEWEWKLGDQWKASAVIEVKDERIEDRENWRELGGTLAGLTDGLDVGSERCGERRRKDDLVLLAQANQSRWWCCWPNKSVAEPVVKIKSSVLDCKFDINRHLDIRD